MLWSISWRADPAGRRIADRHYSRQTVGADQFVAPGRCLVLTTPDALWVTSWPFAQYVKHAWPGAWVCSVFRREGGTPRASELIVQAVAATRWKWPAVPGLGMVTFIDERRVRPTMVRGVPVFGWTFRKAGFVEIGRTKEENLLALQLTPAAMPSAAPPRGATLRLGDQAWARGTPR